MFRILFTFSFLFLIASDLSAQDTITIYYDKDWKKSKSQFYFYYRKIYLDENGLWQARDFYKNGNLQMSGTYLNKKSTKRHGFFTYYFSNGQIEYSGEYRNSKRFGEWNWWSKEGMLTKLYMYNEKGDLDGVCKWWYEDGVLDSEISYKEGVQEGESRFYFKNGQISSSEVYSDGKIISVEMWNEDGSEAPTNGLETNQEPQYPGGSDAMNRFIQKNIVYPPAAIEQNISGTVYIKFVVGNTGEIEDVAVIKKVHPLLDEEALRVVKLMPNWSPGRQHNRPVRVKYTIPINFKFGN